ncbi:hypothetical protein CYMTET_26898, partial [Cymbomonas tetramitiformis]
VVRLKTMGDCVTIKKWLDEELSFLVDEQAVLKYFADIWPEDKVDAIREASTEYSKLELLCSKLCTIQDDDEVNYMEFLTMLEKEMERAEETFYSLLRERESIAKRLQSHGIPVTWLQDHPESVLGKLKKSTLNLATLYMKRVVKEVKANGADGNMDNSIDNPLSLCNLMAEQSSMLTFQGVRFAFRVHQLANGFDEQAVTVFSDLKTLALEQLEKKSLHSEFLEPCDSP